MVLLKVKFVQCIKCYQTRTIVSKVNEKCTMVDLLVRVVHPIYSIECALHKTLLFTFSLLCMSNKGKVCFTDESNKSTNNKQLTKPTDILSIISR